MNVICAALMFVLMGFVGVALIYWANVSEIRERERGAMRRRRERQQQLRGRNPYRRYAMRWETSRRYADQLQERKSRRETGGR